MGKIDFFLVSISYSIVVLIKSQGMIKSTEIHQIYHLSEG